MSDSRELDRAHAAVNSSRMGDPDIRQTLLRELSSERTHDPETVVLEEVGLRHGTARVDVLVVNGCLHGYEVKSEKDTLRRLANQVAVYGDVLDFVTIVVTEKHLPDAERCIPEWWGIMRAEAANSERVALVELRRPVPNPSPNALAIAKLLWRDEALAFLVEVGESKGLLSKPRAFLYSRIVSCVDLDTLRSRVRRQLRCRTDWRSGAPSG